MQQSINDFFTGKSAKNRKHNEMESTIEDKDGDNSDDSSEQNNNETCALLLLYTQQKSLSRAVTTIEVDEATASSDFLRAKRKKRWG